ncbi:MAG: P-II family nitrogen regulator [Actinomycetota bacterium]|jgi:nitrogen regulatory protein P-II 1|nr:P-II family nitrogen regulator [Actinomycetota bacterium]MCL6092561.1 P-II family nitrogen regulator [Actinomycetota bacterium]MDA8166853.1 P-II family nitrogen regulator [Actinomycetota bacterium]
MKKVEAIIRHIKLDDVKTALDGIGIRGMTVTDVKGAGKQKGYTEQWRGSKLNVFLNPKLELKIVVPDDMVESVIDTIVETARTGEIGDGKIFVTNIEEAVAIRSGIRGDEAL